MDKEPSKKRTTKSTPSKRKPTSKKTSIYVLDTSALLQDPSCLTHYKDSTVIIPVTVLGELDKQKNRMDAVGKNARQIPRILAKYKSKGNFLKGVLVSDCNVTIKFCIEDLNQVPESLDRSKPDDRILSACLMYKQDSCNKVSLITNDLYLSLKAEVYGISAVEYRGPDLLSVFEYKGYRTINESRNLTIDELYAEGRITAPKNYKLHENEYCLIKNKAKSNQSAVCIYTKGDLVLINSKISCSKIRPLNLEQTYIMDLLFNPEISLITITGKSGSGKTLVSVAAGLEQVIGKDPTYKKLVVSRSLEVLSGKDKIGFLKGGLDEKLAPFILPLRDAVDRVIGEDRHGFDYLQKDSKKLEIEPLQYIRGRSITNTFFIVDEVQNLTKSDVKTIITRMGEGSKIVLLGDLDQIDNSYVTKTTNGLAQVIEKFKNSSLAGHIELEKGVRSPLATEASNLL